MGGYYSGNDDADQPEVFHQEVIAKSKLNHRCTECGGIIEVGQSYERSSGVWDGRWSTYRKCEKCMAFESAMEQHLRGFAGGNPFGYMYEEIRHTLDSLYSVDHPGRWFSVARKLVAVRQNYDRQRSSGIMDKSGRGVPRRQLFWQRRKHINMVRGMDLSLSEIRIASTMEQS